MIDDELVRTLDPLGVDERIAELWRMNQGADVAALCTLLRSMVATVEEVADLDSLHSLAVMRDIGMVLGSIRRHGPEPLDLVPEVEPVLLALGDRTSMIPRDTIHHITRWNPQGARERSYTGNQGERLLGLSVRTSLTPIMAAIDVCDKLADLPPGTADFAYLSIVLAGQLRELENSVDTAVSGVFPDFFAGELRYYLQDIRVGGKSYYGPAAAHIPLALIDLAVWASDRSNEAYRGFLLRTSEYGVADWRKHYATWPERPSLVTRVSDALREHATQGGNTHGGKLPEDLRIAAEALNRSLRALVAFRGKHLTLARRTYVSDLTELTQGSAGGDLDLLGQITAVTRLNAAYLRRMFKR